MKNQIAPPGQGFHVITDALKDEAKLAGSVQILAGLRKAYNAALERALNRQAFGASIYTFDLVNDKLGKAAMYIYALESAIYMTAGLSDYQKDPDICLEATACRLFATESAKYVQSISKSLLGGNTYLSDDAISRVFDDIEGLNWWESCADLNSLYLGLGGLAYSAENRQEYVSTMRNSLNDMFSSLKAGRQYKKKYGNLPSNPKLRLKLHEHVHPSLDLGAKKVEAMFVYFDMLVADLLVQHGSDIQLQEVDVERLAKTGSDIYVMSSILARANRSYCDGHAHADMEIKAALSFILMKEPSVMNDFAEASKSPLEKLDMIVFNISKYMNEQGKYALVHPVVKNVF